MKRSNLNVNLVPEIRRNEKFDEIMAKNFPKLIEDTKPQI